MRSDESQSLGSSVAIVVTFNRKKLLANCLRALLSQSFSLNAVIVVDNASTDGTESYLKELGLLDGSGKVIYERLSDNTGGAGGFNRGVEIALEAGYQWFWLMDDDAEPQPDAFEILVHDRRVQELGLGVSRIENPDGTLQKRVLDSVLNNDALFKGVGTKDTIDVVYSYPLLGLLVNSDRVRQVGNVKADYFIQADDLDWTLRLSADRGIAYVESSVLKHYDEVRIETIQRFGKPRSYLARKDLWKDYYGFRNLILTMASQNISDWRLLAIKNYVRRVAHRLLVGRDTWFALQIYTRAFWHGISGQTGKRVVPGATSLKS